MNKHEAQFRVENPFLHIERRGRHWIRLTGPQNHVLSEHGKFTKELCTWSYLFDRWHYPYGLWITASGVEIIFNREYRPIWWRCRDLCAQLALPVWVPDIVDTTMVPIKFLPGRNASPGTRALMRTIGR